MEKIGKYLLLIAVFCMGTFAKAQPRQSEKVIDEIVAVVGNNPVLLSDIEGQYLREVKNNPQITRCAILEAALFQKLLVYQAELDSVAPTDEQINGELDRRMRYYIEQFGSKDKLERFYEKTIPEIKEEFREPLRKEIVSRMMYDKITSQEKVSPSEIKKYFAKIPEDSIPNIPTEYEFAQIVKNPTISPEALKEAQDKIRGIYDRIKKGESFETLALLYSEDPGSQPKKGEIGLFTRNSGLAPEFESAAFSLKTKGEVSDIIKTTFGYHILQLIERKGEYINVRHILIIPKVSPLDLAKAKNTLDSIANLIQNKTITFEQALKISDDPGKVNGGMLINPETKSTRFMADQVDPAISFAIKDVEVGGITRPLPYYTEESRTQAYRIIQVKVRTNPHKANLNDDFEKITEWALDAKKQGVVNKWIDSKVKTAYIRIDDQYKDCPFQNKWVK